MAAAQVHLLTRSLMDSMSISAEDALSVARMTINPIQPDVTFVDLVVQNTHHSFALQCSLGAEERLRRLVYWAAYAHIYVDYVRSLLAML